MWWQTDTFNETMAIPAEMLTYKGPEGVALVRVHPNGSTDPGWGEKKFMLGYRAGIFRPARVVDTEGEQMTDFAFVMRSLRLVCVDIDGKNGGLKHAGKLGMLPHTLAETSRSGNGYHLYYFTDEEWDEDKGYAQFSDKINLEQGVDLRATGCVYHYRGQRWNGREIVELPQHLSDRLRKSRMTRDAEVSKIEKVMQYGDDWEVAMMQDALIEDLKKPIPEGRRNTTLFAIGSKLMLADVPGWEGLVRTKADEIGLDDQEIDKLISNISKYGANA